eukprot:434673_1
MGTSDTKEKSGTETVAVERPKQKDPWDIEDLSDHRLYHVEYERKLFEAIHAYWQEVVLHGMEVKEDHTTAKEENDDDAFPFKQDSELGNSDKCLTDKIIFDAISPGSKSKRKNLEYFTADVYDDWTWVLFLDQMLEKQGKLPPLFERAIYHFTVLFKEMKAKNEIAFQYHDAETLAKNEVHEFLWLFIGFVLSFCCHHYVFAIHTLSYQYWSTNSCEYTLGDEMVMFDFLSKLSLLFKVIMIGYTYEQYQYKKIVNHYMKPCLSNISKEVLNRAQSISSRKGLRKKSKKANDYEDETNSMRQVYETIISRMEHCRDSLLENGIQMKRL